MVRPSTLASRKQLRSENNLGHDCLHRQGAEKQSPIYSLLHKAAQEWKLIDIDVPADQNMIRIEDEDVERYQDLQRSFQNQKNSWSLKSDKDTRRDWCNWNHCKGRKDLVCEVRST